MSVSYDLNPLKTTKRIAAAIEQYKLAKLDTTTGQISYATADGYDAVVRTDNARTATDITDELLDLTVTHMEVGHEYYFIVDEAIATSGLPLKVADTGELTNVDVHLTPEVQIFVAWSIEPASAEDNGIVALWVGPTDITL